MSTSGMTRGNESGKTSFRDMRHETVSLTLIELDPSTVADGVWLHECYVTGDIRFAGAAREFCPKCKDVHLQLVLRQEFVKRAHMFCPKCTRCFDARYPDGSEALSLV